ncbi:cation:proton antiporter [Sulfoacidibacillus thermotolerans]|uniref:RCK C-terminal domain-containing protein n=1 Tax=Sulfoacidibacillus thermotolerans TaxID=1765684 RepID=A0A2U3D8I7_SULT2|nr:cation:proton antiporter [Sulfoacidibacillus thermotolerans]PWI57604.1 hypothetical protein BM613_07340 [Sulfoacidibacillus thermotolerans]
MYNTYYSLLFVTVIAFLSPWASYRLTRGLVPAIVVEILLGILVGPSGFHLTQTTTYVNFLSNLAFSYLMFLSGLEIDFDLILQRGNRNERPPWLKGILFFITAMAASGVIAYSLYGAHLVQHPLFLTFILSTTSIGIVTPALKEKGWLLVPYGQEILVYALLADIMTLIFVAAYTTWHTSGNAASVLLVLVLLFIFVAVYRILKAVKGVRMFSVVENATSELGLRGSFALILVFLALAQLLGTQVVVGAFLAGAIISLLSEKHSELTQKLNSIGYGFFLPIFFVNVGLTFNLSSLIGNLYFWLSLAIVFIGMYANKMVATLWWMKGFTPKQRTAAGFLLGSQLSLTIVASKLGQQIGVLPAGLANGLILLSIITCLISPGVFTRLVGTQTRIKHPKNNASLPADFLPEGWIIDQIEILSPRLSHTPMRRLLLPHDVLFISIERGEEKIIPRGHTILEQFDVVHLMGSTSSIERLRNRFKSG